MGKEDKCSWKWDASKDYFSVKTSSSAQDAFEKLAKTSPDKAEAKVLELITALYLLWLYYLLFTGEKNDGSIIDLVIMSMYLILFVLCGRETYVCIF